MYWKPELVSRSESSVWVEVGSMIYYLWLLKADLQQFLSPRAACLAIKTKLWGITKVKKHNVEKTKQTTEPHMVRTPVISTRFKTTVINKLILMMDKVDSMQ